MHDNSFTQDNTLTNRIRRRAGWILLCLAMAPLAIWIGQKWLFVTAECPRLQTALLVVCAIPMAVLMALVAMATTRDSPASQLLRASIALVVGLGAPAIIGVFASQLPGAQAQFCACPDADRIARLRSEGRLEAAREIAYSSVETPECQFRCQCELAWVLYERAGELLDAHDCIQAAAVLDEAESLVEQCNDASFVQAMAARRQTYDVVCGPTPTPPPSPVPSPTTTPTPIPIELEILHTTLTENQASIDVRVMDMGTPLSNLSQEAFSVIVGGEVIPVEAFEERGADDPVCVIAVVDNSESIQPGLTQIRDALQTLNTSCKPGDLLGMVLFDEAAAIVQQPGEGMLNPQAVTGTGNMTALWDGIELGLEQAQSCGTELRYLIVLTDGANNIYEGRSGDNLYIARGIASEIERQNVNICTVGVESAQLDSGPLERVSVGCSYYHTSSFDEVATQFREIFGFVRDFYRLTFSPDALMREQTVTLLFEDVGREGGEEIDFSD